MSFLPTSVFNSAAMKEFKSHFSGYNNQEESEFLFTNMNDIYFKFIKRFLLNTVVLIDGFHNFYRKI